MERLVDPVNVQSAQNVPVPQVGGIETDPELQNGDGLRHHVVGGHQCDVVLEKCRPDGPGRIVVFVGPIQQGVEGRGVDVYGFGGQRKCLKLEVS